MSASQQLQGGTSAAMGLLCQNRRHGESGEARAVTVVTSIKTSAGGGDARHGWEEVIIQDTEDKNFQTIPCLKGCLPS